LPWPLPASEGEAPGPKAATATMETTASQLRARAVELRAGPLRVGEARVFIVVPEMLRASCSAIPIRRPGAVAWTALSSWIVPWYLSRTFGTESSHRSPLDRTCRLEIR
jgi:hypothetical protein